MISCLQFLLILLAKPVRKYEFILNLDVKIHTTRCELLSNCSFEIRTKVL